MGTGSIPTIQAIYFDKQIFPELNSGLLGLQGTSVRLDGANMGRGIQLGALSGGYTPGSNFNSQASGIADVMKYTVGSNATVSNTYNAAKIKV